MLYTSSVSRNGYNIRGLNASRTVYMSPSSECRQETPEELLRQALASSLIQT